MGLIGLRGTARRERVELRLVEKAIVSGVVSIAQAESICMCHSHRHTPTMTRVGQLHLVGLGVSSLVQLVDRAAESPRSRTPSEGGDALYW